MCGICLVFYLQVESGSVCEAALCISLLQRLQHRGRQMAKIVTDSQEMGGIGMVDKIFDSFDKSTLTGSCCIGHTRYSTSPSLFSEALGHVETQQPFDIYTPFSERLIIAHNGQLGGQPEECKKIIHFLQKKNMYFVLVQTQKFF